MIFVTQGLRINSDCRYFRFVESKIFSIIEDTQEKTLTVNFIPGMTSEDVKGPHMIMIEKVLLKPVDYTKIVTPTINLDGLVFTKLTQTPMTFQQFVVGDVDKLSMRFSEDRCEIIIPSTKILDIKCYVKLLHNNPYIKISNTFPKVLHNIDSIQIHNQDINITSDNDFIFHTKKKYSKYILSPVMIQSSFISGLRNILQDYGLELLSLPIDKNTASPHRVTYRFTDVAKQSSPKSTSFLQYLQKRVDHIEFSLSTPDLTILYDFRNKYQNLNLVSNFTEFDTMDKLQRHWKSAVWWNPISTDFDQNYSTDENGNIGFTSTFSADIHYDTVFDESFIRIQSIINTLLFNNELKLVTVES